MSLGGGKLDLSVCSPSDANDRPRQTSLRALEGVKDKLQPISEPSGAAEHAESEGVIFITVCVLADDFRGAIVEYRRLDYEVCVTIPNSRFETLPSGISS